MTHRCQLDTFVLVALLALTASSFALAQLTFSDCLASSVQDENRFDITFYGAIGDGSTSNTQAIRKTFDIATGAIINGEISTAFVWVPPGTFVTGSFNLSSSVYLCLSDGAMLLGSNSSAEYVLVESITSDTGRFDYPLVFALGVNQTGVLGSGQGEGVQGEINGGMNYPLGNFVKSYDPVANFLTPVEWDLPYCSFFSCRPKLMVLRLSSDIVLQGFSLMNSVLWTLTFSQSQFILVDQMHIEGNRQWPNNDGLDCISCSLRSTSPWSNFVWNPRQQRSRSPRSI
jgi:polygalacturonase